MEPLRSQEDIDNVFRSLQPKGSREEAASKAVPYDFRWPDRIAKDQLRSIHLLHDSFARNLASSLSAYLRAYVTVNLVSVRQVSYAEFVKSLPSPTCLVSLSMKPYEGSVILELNPNLVFPILEMLLGGTGKASAKINREVTEIEQVVLDGVYHVILQDLRQAWHGVAQIDFAVDSRETEPHLLQIVAPAEAVVAIGLAVRMAENSGMMNLAIPSIIIKLLRQKFDQQWSVRRSESKEGELSRSLRLVKPAVVRLDARLEGPTLQVADLMQLKMGDVLAFDYPVNKPLSLLLNGKLKYRGQLAGAGRNKAFVIEEAHRPIE